VPSAVPSWKPKIIGFFTVLAVDTDTSHLYGQFIGAAIPPAPNTGVPDMLKIFVQTRDGREFQAFTWTRDEASGIARAMREGREFGHDIVKAWAIPA
jgi:hypothetical protein